jgi:hypothetical protein
MSRSTSDVSPAYTRAALQDPGFVIPELRAWVVLPSQAPVPIKRGMFDVRAITYPASFEDAAADGSPQVALWHGLQKKEIYLRWDDVSSFMRGLGYLDPAGPETSGFKVFEGDVVACRASYAAEDAPPDRYILLHGGYQIGSDQGANCCGAYLQELIRPAPHLPVEQLGRPEGISVLEAYERVSLDGHAFSHPGLAALVEERLGRALQIEWEYDAAGDLAAGNLPLGSLPPAALR